MNQSSHISTNYLLAALISWLDGHIPLGAGGGAVGLELGVQPFFFLTNYHHNYLKRDREREKERIPIKKGYKILTPGLPGIVQCHTIKFTVPSDSVSGFATKPCFRKGKNEKRKNLSNEK